MTPLRRLTLLFRILTLAGIVCFACGMFTGPGVPYQDPTPTQQQEEARAFQRSGWFLQAGFILLATALPGLIVLRLAPLLRKPTR